MISNHLRRACVRMMTIVGFSIATEACILVRQELTNEINV